ncbi:MAG: methyltransferase [Sphingobacteriales bacterium]|nr:methyltransferase [Sphingobacteriales bacterium]MBI3718397.1 methyltransferase [Sphingobacteriales bacterium]
MIDLNADYWSGRYKDDNTGWDIGHVSAPIKEYIDQLTNKSLAILIPGCGNSYEAEYLLKNSFTNITLIDISPVLTKKLEDKFNTFNHKQLTIIAGNFFDLKGKFDLIIEQTFFCALDPALRKAYVDKMYDLLKPGGKIAGVLFNKEFEGGPPFGGTKEEYVQLFADKFKIKTMESCYNSIAPRKDSEVFIIMQKTESLPD